MRLIVVGGLVASFLFATLVHADTTTVVPIGDPYSDTLQLWTSIATAIEAVTQDGMSAANQLTAAVQRLALIVTVPPSSATPTHPSAPAQAPTAAASLSSLPAAAADSEPAQSLTQHVITYAVQSGDTLSGIAQMFGVPVSSILSANSPSQGAIPQPGDELIIPDPQTAPAASNAGAPDAASKQTTISQNDGSADFAPTNPTRASLPTASSQYLIAATPVPDYVTQDELTADLLALSAKFTSPNTPAVPQYVGADGNSDVPYAAVSNIGRLSGVTITDANLTASEIPDLSGEYLSLGGGTVTGTTTLSGTLALSGPLYASNASPGLSGDVLQSTGSGVSWVATSSLGISDGGGSLWGYPFPNNATTTTLDFSDGLLSVASTTVGNGTQAGGLTISGGATTTGNAYFAGNVGIGTTTPGSIFSINNILNVTAATSTFYTGGGINLTSGCFAVGGTCISGGGSLWGYPFPNNATTTTLDFSDGLLSVASTTVGNGTQAGGLTISGGATTTGNVLIQGALTSAASSSLTVGNPASPAFQVLASSTNAATGLQLISNMAGNGIMLQGITSGTSDTLTINAAGAGGNQSNLNLNTSGNVFLAGNTLTIYNQASEFNYSRGPSNTAATDHFLVQDAADPALTAGTEAPEVYFNLGHATRTHANGTIATQRDFRISGTTHAFSSYSPTNNIGNLVAVSIDPSQQGINGTTTNNIGLQVTSQALNASTTNAYGLQVNASTGAVNNVAGQFFGELTIGTEPGTTLPSNSLFLISSSTAGATTTLFTILNNGSATLAGTLTQNSDQRLKTNIQSLDASSSLAAIDALRPVTFNWVNGIFGDGLQTGFIAQEVQLIFPNLVSTTSPTALTPNGTLGLNYTGLIAPVVSAVQQLSADLTAIENTIAGFATSFTTQQLTFTRDLCAQESNGVQVCITGDQLAALVAQAGAEGEAADQSSAVSNYATDTPPIIQVDGNNPAIVQVGATYNDLGATITGPQQDLNLGITTYLNGVETSPVQLDTSAAATDTIDYVVTDQNGLTSTSTRTVIIETATAPSILPPDDASTTTDDTEAGNPGTDTAATSTAQ